MDCRGRWVQVYDCQPKVRLRDRLKSERQVIADIRKGIKIDTLGDVYYRTRSGGIDSVPRSLLSGKG